MSERTVTTELHYVDIWREDEWPHQWIGVCACGRGIRCNSGRHAEEFFDRQGCARAPQTGVSARRIASRGAET